MTEGQRAGLRRGALAGALVALLLSVWPVAPARADDTSWVPDRRRNYDERRPNEYLIVPAVASLPGIGVFAGVISSGTNVASTGMDVAATVARSIDNTDIDVQFLAIREIPIWRPYLTFEYWTGHIRLGNLQSYLPGRDSPNFTIPVRGEFNYSLARPVLHFWERRITMSYTASYFDGFNFDENGNEVSIARNGASTELNFDFTDDVVNPVRGVRFNYRRNLPAPSNSLFGHNRGPHSALNQDDVTIENYELIGYIPIGERFDLVLDSQFFQARGGEGQGGVVAGGSPPLRGYPEGRWSDRYGVFAAAELRYTIPVNWDLDISIARGIVEGLQFAAFTDAGQVAPRNDSLLFKDLHHSYGFGVRALFEAIVLRFDLAVSDEGPQTHLTIDQPF